MDTPTALPIVFVSYSHQDEAWKDRLVKQLRVLELEGRLKIWDDRDISAGDAWLREIEAAIAQARAAVLLVSVDFLNSWFIREKEVPELLSRREREGLRVIPVIVRPCAWKAVEALSRIQCRPKDGKPLASFSRTRAEQHLADLALEIRGLLTPPGTQTTGYQEKAVPAGTELPSRAAHLHNLPYPQLGALFTGRQEELGALEHTGTTAISGLGGIGKTRLAVEYAWRSGNHYTAAWFVRADSAENLHRNLAALAGPELLNLPEWEARDEDKTVAAVRSWLREHPGWLMVLDNVDTPEAVDAVLEVLPSLSDSRVLITSRLTTWPASVRKQSLDKLSREEAVRFLLHRTGDGREPAADDATQAADLAERVDGLPLALEQAAAYIIRHRMRFAAYLRAWEQEHDKLLQWYDPRVMQYPASVAVTWKQTLDRLSPTPAALLRLTAFLAPDPIPFDMLEQGAEHVKKAVGLFCQETGTAADGKTIHDATADLTDYSLVTRQDGGMLVVHRLMQEALRSQIPEEHERDWIEGALRIVDGAVPEDPSDARTWPVWNRLRPHVSEVVARADEVGIVEPTSRLMNDLGQLLKATDLYTEAEQWMRRALAFDEVAFGDEHPNVSVRLNNLARLLHDTNRLDEAEPLMRRALSIDEAAFGNEHPNVATQLNNLAGLLKATDRLEEAEPLMRRALAIDESAFGNHDSRVSIRLNNLAALLYTTNRLGEAEPLMRRALAIDEAAYGNENPNVARDLNNLAWLLHDTNRLAEAEPLMRRAVEIWESSLGPEHPSTEAVRSSLEIFIAEIPVTAPGGQQSDAAP
jgi:tetratricopeptide (TPR) repeat protein